MWRIRRNKTIFHFINKNFQNFSNYVKIVEVGPRDGLQNEKKILPSTVKIDFINKLSETGLTSIETTSFVSSKWIPQMSDNSEVFKNINKKSNINYPVLVPNLRGLEQAMLMGVKEIAIFSSASETFSLKNINCTIDESIQRYEEVITQAKRDSLKIRGYISCIAGCPYEGDIKSSAVAKLSETMLSLGCYEVSLGDTIGIGTPKKIKNVLNEVKRIFPNQDLSNFALHCHDTYGQGIGNIYSSLDYGIRVFDSSVGGLGGCPYADGASGNIATEDLIYFLHGEGFITGIQLDKIVDIGKWINNELGRKNQSKVGIALLSKLNK